MKFLAAFLAFSSCVASANAAEGAYTYDTNNPPLLPPSRWAEVEGAAACAGSSQSPVALDKSVAAQCANDQPDFVFNGGNCKVGNIVAEPNPGNWGDVSFNTDCQGASLQFGSKTYNFKALHLHSMAEHGLGPANNAELPDAELHLVHVNAADPNDLLVIGLFLQVKRGGLLGGILDVVTALTGLPLFSNTQCDTAIAAILGKLEQANGGAFYSGNNNALLNIYDLVPRRGYLTYPGSLTTPPCSETVTWIVNEQLVRITSAQLSKYRTGLANAAGSLASDEGNNNRPLQALNGRTVAYCQF